jgi:hypothetical protein
MVQAREKIGVPPVLQDVSVRYKNPDYVADRIFPIINNCPPEAKILRYLKGAWFRDEAGIMGPGSEAPRGSFPIDFIDVIPVKYGFAKEVYEDDRETAAAQGAPPLEPDTDAIEFATDRVLMKREVIAATVVKATIWSGVAATGEDAQGLWAPAGATNTFILDVETRKETIRSATGFKPNVLLMDAITWSKVKQVEAVLDRIKYGGGEADPAKVTTKMIAALFELDEVLVAGAIKSTAKETKAGTDFTSAPIWTVNTTKGMAFLSYRPARPGLKIPSPGYIARSGLYPEGIRVRTWREESKNQDLYEAAEKAHILAACLDLGFMWSDTNAD